MPILLTDPARQGPLRRALRTAHGIQTSLLYPPVHRFTAYRELYPGISLPLTEQAGRSEVTLPLFPHLTEAEQDRVVEALIAELPS
jgi:dTDP-4-amino-4,6-dideoxygalactose transaminase